MLEQLDNRQRIVVRVLVEMLAPYKWRAYDPCCGSASMFVKNEKFVERPWRAQMFGDNLMLLI